MTQLGSAFGEIRIGTGQAEKSVTNLANSLRDVGTKMSLGISAPLAAIGAAGIKSAAAFSQTMAVVKSVSGATAEQMAQMSAKALQLGKDTSFSAGEAANGLLELAKAGMSSEAALASIGGVLDLAAAGNLSVASAAEITANALNAFQLPAEQAVRVADLLAASANASSIEVTDMAQAFNMSASVFASNKQSVEDLSTAIAIMGNNGIKGSDAGTSLKTMLMRLTAPTDTAAKAIDKLGLRVYNTDGSMRGFEDIVKDLAASTAHLSDEQRNQAFATIFGADAIRAANILVGAGAEEWDNMERAVTKAGAAQEVAGARMKGLAGAIEYIKGTIDSTLTAAFLPLDQALGDMVRWIADLIGKFGDLPQPVINAALAFGAVMAAAGPLLVALPLLGGVLAALLSSIGLVVVAAAGLAAAWAADWGGIQEKTRAAVGVITELIRNLWTGITTGDWQPLLDSLSGLKMRFQLWFRFLKADIKNWFEGWWTQFTGTSIQTDGIMAGLESLKIKLQIRFAILKMQIKNWVDGWWSQFNDTDFGSNLVTAFNTTMATLEKAINDLFDWTGVEIKLPRLDPNDLFASNFSLQVGNFKINPVEIAAAFTGALVLSKFGLVPNLLSRAFTGNLNMTAFGVSAALPIITAFTGSLLVSSFPIVAAAIGVAFSGMLLMKQFPIVGETISKAFGGSLTVGDYTIIPANVGSAFEGTLHIGGNDGITIGKAKIAGAFEGEIQLSRDGFLSKTNINDAFQSETKLSLKEKLFRIDINTAFDGKLLPRINPSFKTDLAVAAGSGLGLAVRNAFFEWVRMMDGYSFELDIGDVLRGRVHLVNDKYISTLMIKDIFRGTFTLFGEGGFASTVNIKDVIKGSVKWVEDGYFATLQIADIFTSKLHIKDWVVKLDINDVFSGSLDFKGFFGLRPSDTGEFTIPESFSGGQLSELPVKAVIHEVDYNIRELMAAAKPVEIPATFDPDVDALLDFMKQPWEVNVDVKPKGGKGAGLKSLIPPEDRKIEIEPSIKGLASQLQTAASAMAATITGTGAPKWWGTEPGEVKQPGFWGTVPGDVPQPGFWGGIPGLVPTPSFWGGLAGLVPTPEFWGGRAGDVPKPSWWGTRAGYVEMVNRGVQAAADALSNAMGSHWFKGGLTWVGERGPELVDLPRGSRIYDNTSSKQMAGGGGGVTMHITNIINNELDLEMASHRMFQIAQRYQPR